MTALKALPLLAILLAAGGCAQLDRARLAVDAGTAVAREVNTEILYQADIERHRLRALRCMDPLLTPDALAAAYADPRLGRQWLNELLRDCPQFAGLLGALAQDRLLELEALRSRGLL